MEKVAQSGDHVRDLAQAVGSVTRRFALSGQWAWAWQTAEEHEFPSTEDTFVSFV